MKIRSLLCFLSLAFLSAPLFADLEVAPVFGSHMVLQRDHSLPVWGTATPGDTVTVSFRSHTIQGVADDAGSWRVDLPKQKVGDPSELIISAGEETLAFTDVLVGEVWICSGQSNMQWPLKRAMNAEDEIAAADIPGIRLFQVPTRPAPDPATSLNAAWEVCSPETAASFSAVAYFFGRNLHETLGVPIGLIHASKGGSVAEAWIPREALAEDGNYPDLVAGTEPLRTRMLEIPDLENTLQREIEAFDQRAKELFATGAEPEPEWFNPAGELGQTRSLPLGENFLQNTDGQVQVRKVFSLSAQQAARPGARLKLGRINDVDKTWVNGVLVGETGPDVRGAAGRQRDYPVPEGTLKEGENVIVVQMIDLNRSASLGSGIQYPKLDWADGEHVALVENWRMKLIQDLGPRPQSLDRTARKSATFLYNGMIAPLIPFAFRGVIWYQGESNAGRAAQYVDLFPHLIRTWRQKWAQGPFPFYFVQLANFRERADSPGESNWAELREAQRLTQDLENTGMAVAIDVGEADDIHPGNKQAVGKRLALWALAQTYSVTESKGWVAKIPLLGRMFRNPIPHSGPLYKSVKAKKDTLRVRFDHTSGGLTTTDGEAPVSFAIAEEDGPFRWAEAEIISDDTVQLSHPEMETPRHVRYAWANNPAVNLVNGAGLPASPFRTDTRPWTTAEEDTD
jgi:sialate O-acetylesterase